MELIGAQNRSVVLLAALLTCLVHSGPGVYSLATSTNHNSSENDRQALLCLRSHLSCPAGVLDSWRNDSFTFCNWHGVSCSTRHTARVVALDLGSLNITGKLSPCIAGLRFLNTIDMASNHIGGHIPPEIGHLTRLRYLNLSMNSITGVIPESISSCSRLEVIRLKNNSIEGEIPQSLAHLQFLKEIILSNNKLNGTIPLGIGFLPKLQFLFLPSNNLEGSIPETLGSSPLLSKVVVRNNSLTGGVPAMLANCSSLYYLDLRKNKLSGNIPPALFNSTSLITLDLSLNNLSGSIPSSSLAISQLQYVSLTGNNISGDIPATLGNISSLSTLLLAQNNLQGSIPENIASIPSLRVLDLAYNNLSGRVPQRLYSIPNLTYLGLGVNRLVGRIPNDIGYTLPNIQILVMEGNQFEGPLPLSLVNAFSLQALQLRDNVFNGVIPSFWSLPNLMELDLGANQFEAVDWSSLSSKTSSTKLQRIFLDHNKLQGILPDSIGNLPRSLQQLYLTKNEFTGTIPSNIGNLTNLTVLQLQGNSFSGGIPETLGNLGNLFALSLAHNKLSCEIPQSIGNLEKLSELYLQENYLNGSIPASLAGNMKLVMLNLSHNDLHGSIPAELFSISSLSKGLDVSYNKLTGSISSNIGDLINLSCLNISNNQLSGEIPLTLGDCLFLESMRFEVNDFSGNIPASFESLRGLTDIDLSQNNLSGEIPNFLETFSTLQYLNLSFNNLEGLVPTGGVFSSPGKVFIQGNKRLCGNNPTLQLPICSPTLGKRIRSHSIISIAVSLSSIIFVLTTCVAIIHFKKRVCPKKHIDESWKEMKKFSYSDLAKATDEFSSTNLVGAGRYGMVYRGTFKFEERPFAIKVFKLHQIGAPKNLFVECEVLRNTRHRNLMRVISLCSSSDRTGNEFKALILEYMCNGSLESWLHPKARENKKIRPLNLGSRIMIAMDIAAAVDYLHNQCTPSLVHCDLKPSNVLLDDDMVAHVSDFGLTKFLHNHSSSRLHSSTTIGGPRGSVGYIAPEYGMGCEISTAGDVYSYGIILLQMLTGKHPTDDMFKNEMNLHKLVQSAFPQNIGDILDRSLNPWYKVGETNYDSGDENEAVIGMQNCIHQLAKLGLRCSLDSPKARPAIKDVYSEIMTIRETFSALSC